MSLYNDEFYAARHKNTIYAAETILGIVRELVPDIASAVDLGCGVGTWLSVIENFGATDVCGVDGSWVNQEYLEIPKESFIGHDLSKDVNPRIDRTFDLAISLEVAEHLPASSADGFVATLTSLSEVVLFSAAIPLQGGVGHINEQWADYWVALFEKRDYVPIDIIRKRIWDDENIPTWYRQNAIVFMKRDRAREIEIPSSAIDHVPPEMYLLSFKQAAAPPGIKHALHGLLGAVRRRIGRMVGGDS